MYALRRRRVTDLSITEADSVELCDAKVGVRRRVLHCPYAQSHADIVR